MMAIKLSNRDALLLVDVQVDFLPGGRLAVPHGDSIVPKLNAYLAMAKRKGIPVFASRDWHPSAHCSFSSRGGPWPAHCVAGTPGAAFAPGLEFPAGTLVVSKATEPDDEAYSAFHGTDLAARLRGRSITRLLVCGLATDYCVLRTVRDALDNGLEVLLLEDAIRAVNARPGDGERAEREMRDAGAVPVRLEAFAP